MNNSNSAHDASVQKPKEILKNCSFNGLNNDDSKKILCEEWSIQFAGLPKTNSYSSSYVGDGLLKRVRLNIESVEKWFRIVQEIDSYPENNPHIFEITASVPSEFEVKKSIISRLSIMRIDESGYFHSFSVLGRNIEITSFPRTRKFNISPKKKDLSARYALVFEFNTPQVIDIWSVSMLERAVSYSNSSSHQTNNIPSDQFSNNLGGNQIADTFRHYVDYNDINKVVGWAISEQDVQSIFEIDVLIDGIFFTKIKNDSRRDDLAKKGLTSGQGGFILYFPQGLFRSDKHEIILRFPDNTYSEKIVITNSNPIYEKQLVYLDSNVSNVNIIVPVFNAYNELKICIERLYLYTPDSQTIVLIDDCSTDERILEYLNEISSDDRIVVLRNTINMGFSATVNKGIEYSRNRDVVLLNSDARVTNAWLESLYCAAYTNKNIATVTPLSNSAGAFSAPIIGKENVINADIEENNLARKLREISERNLPEVPTGNGFCMFVKRECIDDVGYFDHVAFPRGYGEENDFCMRARRNGWKHILDDSTLVFHKSSSSFGDQKNKLIKDGRCIVDKRYPEYSKLTGVFQNSVCSLARYRVAQSIDMCSKFNAYKSRILFVYSTQTGGTPQTNRDLMGELHAQVDTWTLRCDKQFMYLNHFSKDGIKKIVTYRLEEPINPVDHTSDEYDLIVKKWLEHYDISLVHIRHMAWHSLNLPKIASSINIPVVMSFHDFYSLCPTVNLLDEENRFCNGTCTPISKIDCESKLWPVEKIPKLKNDWVHQWRKQQQQAFQYCRAFVTTSISAKNTILSIYPELENRFHVIEHGRNLVMAGAAYTPPSVKGPIRVLVPGNISKSKGFNIIRDVLNTDCGESLEFHVLGKIDGLDNQPGLINHGTYNREEFLTKVNKISPTVVGIFSIWDETWCHTLTEAWSVGLPVIVLDFPTLAKRVNGCGGGWVLSYENPLQFIDKVNQVVREPKSYQIAKSAVLDWQYSTGASQTAGYMATKYFDIYRFLILKNDQKYQNTDKNNLCCLTSFKSQEVAVLCPADPGLKRSPASTYIRIWARTRTSINSQYTYFRCSSEHLLMGIKNGSITTAVIQRNAIPVQMIDIVVNAIKADKLKVILDIDDNLLIVPEDKDLIGTYQKERDALKKLIKNCQILSVSTNRLKEELEPDANRVEVINNRLDSAVWNDINPNRFVRDKDKTVLFYMGSLTHDEDLQLLIPAFLSAAEKCPNLYLKICGGFANLPSELPECIEIVKIPNKAKYYPEFVKYLATVTVDVDFAVGPLVDSEFNEYKSGLKYLEYSALGLAGLYSKRPVYDNLNAEFGGVPTLPDDEKYWVEAILNAVQNLDQLHSMGKEARNWAMSNYTLNDTSEMDQLVSKLQVDKQNSIKRSIANVA